MKIKFLKNNLKQKFKLNFKNFKNNNNKYKLI